MLTFLADQDLSFNGGLFEYALHLILNQNFHSLHPSIILLSFYLHHQRSNIYHYPLEIKDNEKEECYEKDGNVQTSNDYRNLTY